jgi:crossover junction endodeoxyribonuclease RusA
VFPPDKRKRDIDNLLKSLLDSLTHAKVWKDDNQISDLRIYRNPIIAGMVKVRVYEQRS